jgi:hypothetical protein
MSMKERGIFNREGQKGLQIMAKVLAETPAILRREITAELSRT